MRDHVAFMKSLGYKLRTEILVLEFVTDLEHGQSHTEFGEAKLLFLFYKTLDVFFDSLVGVLRYGDLVQGARERSLGRTVESLYAFDTETIVSKTIKVLHVFLQTDGDMGVVESHPQAQCLGNGIGHAHQQHVNVSLFHRMRSS